MRYRFKITLLLYFYFLATSQIYTQKSYSIFKLAINSSQFNEYAPIIHNGYLIFCSDRKNDFLVNNTDMNNNSLSDIYKVKQKKGQKFLNPQRFSNELTTKYYEGPACINSEGDKIYFTRTITVSKKLNNMNGDSTYGIFYSEKINTKWTEPKALFCNNEYNTGFPFITEDGKQLYFASQAPGGFGGFDIYVSENKDGNWQTPVNLGNKINTSENDVFPFLHKSNRLYFSSRGHEGKGGLDIFYSQKNTKGWEEIVHLPDLNTKSDDFGLVMNESMDTGFFTSTRSKTMDIYMFYSTLPVYSKCKPQQKNDLCYIFYETGTADMDTSSLRYEWDMGDGTKIRKLEAEHCFKEVGEYHIALNMVDTLTGKVYYNEAIYDFVVENVEQPYISCPDTAYLQDLIKFDAKKSFFKDAKAKGYIWDFDDETRANGLEVSHSFQKPGQYTIQLGMEFDEAVKNNLPETTCVTKDIVILRKRD